MTVLQCAAFECVKPQSRARLSFYIGRGKCGLGKSVVKVVITSRTPLCDPYGERPISRSTNAQASQFRFAGRIVLRNSLVSGTAPSGTLTVSRTWPLLEMASPQLPPPRSTIKRSRR